jgi:hypothetical protein
LDQLLSSREPEQAKKNIEEFEPGPTANVIVETLWDEAKQALSEGRSVSATIIGATCAEAAHRLYCLQKGVGAKLVRGKWETLIDKSASRGIIPSDVKRILRMIRKNYRNMWIHVNVSAISKNIPVPKTAGTVSASGTSSVVELSREDYKAIHSILLSENHAVEVLWLTALTLSHLYGGQPALFDKI